MTEYIICFIQSHLEVGGPDVIANILQECIKCADICVLLTINGNTGTTGSIIDSALKDIKDYFAPQGKCRHKDIQLKMLIRYISNILTIEY